MSRIYLARYDSSYNVNHQIQPVCFTFFLPYLVRLYTTCRHAFASRCSFFPVPKPVLVVAIEDYYNLIEIEIILSKALLKSSSRSLIEAIMNALSEASELANTHCDTPLSRMPEYFMGVHVAHHFSKNFTNFGYGMEASVKETLADAGVSEAEIIDLLEIKKLRENGRFDLVPRTGRRGIPVHVIEFKRGSRSAHMFTDLKRLSYVSMAVPDASRLRTNYLVFTTRTSRNRLHEMLKMQEAEDNAASPRGCTQLIYTLLGYQEIPHWAKGDFKQEPRFMAVALFEVQSRK